MTDLPEPAEPVVLTKAPTSFASTAPSVPQTKPSGGDGVAVYGGFIVSNETDRRLMGRDKWVTYDNQTLNIAIIASALNVWTTLGGSAKWTAVPDPRGGKDGERGAELVTDGLIGAPLSTPWQAVVRRQLVKKFRGFSLHEVIPRRRRDGVWVVADLQDRPQWTVFRWDKPDEQSGWLGIEQLTRMGKNYYIERERLFYSVENTLSATPDGVGILRQTAEHARVLELYEQWEGIGLQTDLRGVPLARAPLAKLLSAAPSGLSDNEKRQWVQQQVTFLQQFLLGHNKRADQGVMLDSSTYRTVDEHQTPSNVPEWAFELIRGGSSGLPEVGAAIARKERAIARIIGAEFLLLGASDSGGAYSMHADKTAMFGLTINAGLTDVANDAKRDIARRIVALNGLDPETCTPDLVPEPVSQGSVESACRSLMMMFQAGLDPRDKAIGVLRGRMDLPTAPDIDERTLLLPRGTEVEQLGANGQIVGQVGIGAPGTPPASPGKTPRGVGAPAIPPKGGK